MINENIKNGILISVIIPCRNEKKHIEECLRSLLSQDFPQGEYEVLVVDGLSSDGTREILNQLATENQLIHVIDNEKKTTPAAMNLGIRNASGENIAICGAHSKYDSKFLSSAIELLQNHKDVGCVGGPIYSVGENDFAKAVAYAMSSSIGVGNAKHRFPDYEGYAEMACFPMFRREVFDKIGYYDESLIRNQDDEFSLRFRLSGGKVFISPRVKSLYYVRNSPRKLFKQYFNYGFWRWIVIKKHKIQISYRQVIPSLFIISVLFFIFVGLVFKSYPIIFVIPSCYLVIIAAFSFRIALKESFKIGILFYASVVILHFSYGIGVIYSYLRDKFNIYWK